MIIPTVKLLLFFRCKHPFSNSFEYIFSYFYHPSILLSLFYSLLCSSVINIEKIPKFVINIVPIYPNVHSRYFALLIIIALVFFLIWLPNRHCALCLLTCSTKALPIPSDVLTVSLLSLTFLTVIDILKALLNYLVCCHL